MPIHIPENFFQVTVHATCGEASGEICNVFGVHDATDHTAQEVATAVLGFWENDFLDFFHEGYVLSRVHAEQATGGQEADAFSSENGTVSGGAAPMNVAALAKKQSGLSGRKNRGRMYFGCVPEAYTVGSSLESSGVTQLQAGCDAFLLDLTGENIPMYILHNSNAAPTLVGALVVETRLATQRGRLRD